MLTQLPNLKRETRYGLPDADQILFNRHYVLGYSYYFRQAKWALEIVDKDRTDVSRLDNYRTDHRVPEKFRAENEVYVGSGYEKGHLVSSANQIETEIQNSETFLLSNMCPQKPTFNAGVWKRLETAVRKLDAKPEILETYVISGPLFYFDQEVIMMGENNVAVDVTLPIPHAFFKSILVEYKTGKIWMWSFIIPNKRTSKKITLFRVKTSLVEKISGMFLWETLVGTKMNSEKNKIHAMWR